MSIDKMGFSNIYSQQDHDKSKIFRVISSRKNSFLLNNGETEDILCQITGKMIHEHNFPVTGDFVLVENGVIVDILERKNTLSRGKAGSKKYMREQIIASNLDYVFIVSGLDRDFNLRRMERYLTLAYNSSITPVIILNKTDLHEDISFFMEETESIAIGVDIIPVSTVKNHGLEDVKRYLKPGYTAALVGSSGAGKSSIINSLLNFEKRKTGEISAFSNKGKHTTTSRELITLESRAMIIDNPGIRELALMSDGNGVTDTFSDIFQLAEHCKFRDCSHENEPGCNVRKAVEKGLIDKKRVENLKRLIREEKYSMDRLEKSPEKIEREKWKKIRMQTRKLKDLNGRYPDA